MFCINPRLKKLWSGHRASVKSSLEFGAWSEKIHSLKWKVVKWLDELNCLHNYPKRQFRIKWNNAHYIWETARLTGGDHNVSLELKWSREKDILANDTINCWRRKTEEGCVECTGFIQIRPNTDWFWRREPSSKFRVCHSLAARPWPSYLTSLNFRFLVWFLLVHHRLVFLCEELPLHTHWDTQCHSWSHDTKTA